MLEQTAAERQETAAIECVGLSKVYDRQVAALNDLSLTVPRGQQVQTSPQLNPELEAPVAKGAVVGKVVASSEGKPIGEAPLVAQAAVERAGFMLRSWQHLTRLFGK